VTPAIRALADGVIRRVNGDCVQRMERILDFAESPDADAPDAVTEFAGREEEATRPPIVASRMRSPRRRG